MTSRVVILAGLLSALRPLPAHTDGHAVAVTSPAPASLTAELYTPRGSGPFPAVILMHGCGGISPNVKEWAVWLRHEGYAAFILDSFGGRGLKRLCAGSAQLTGSMRAPDVFAAASASSPATDWRQYDTIYTERYMWMPQENKAGYDAGSAMTYAKDLTGRLLLYYGTADNNVHPSNTLQLVKALQDAGKSFELQVGPDRGHSGVNQDRMMEFFIQNLVDR